MGKLITGWVYCCDQEGYMVIYWKEFYILGFRVWQTNPTTNPQL